MSHSEFDEYGFDTLAVRAGQVRTNECEQSEPIFTTTSYVFNKPPIALPLEGVAGNGDSGGPVLVAVGDEWRVAGLTSWKRVDGNPASRPGPDRTDRPERQF